MYRVLVSVCLVALHMGPNSVEASPVDGGVLFDSSFLIRYKMPSSCKGMSFCFDKGDDYPESTFEMLFDKTPVSLNARIATNFQLDAKSNPDCPANTTFINKPIYYIRDENDQVRAVAQSPKFQQIHGAKWCQRPGQITEDTPNFLKGSRTLKKYRIECVNQFMEADFFVLSDEDGYLNLKLARPKGGIPVCCRCRYSNMDDY